MIRFLAILLSTLLTGGMAWAFGPLVLVALPLLVLAILFGEQHAPLSDAQSAKEANGSHFATDF